MCGGKKEEKKAIGGPPLPEPPPSAPEEPAPVPTEEPKGAKDGHSSMYKASDTIIQKNTAEKSLVFQSMIGGKKATGNLAQSKYFHLYFNLQTFINKINFCTLGPAGGRSVAKSMAAARGAQQSLMLTSSRAPAAKDVSQAFKAKSVKKN